MGDWIMYHEIKQMLRQGHNISSVAQITGIDRRSVKKYASMTEAEYTAFLENKETRTKVLAAYETFVKDRLLDVSAATAAQVHDWLKEHHPSFPKTSPKTVYNFVMGIRPHSGARL